MTDEVKTNRKSKTESVPLKQTTKSRTMRSEHKRAKKTFEPSSQLFQALIQNASDAIVVISPEFTIRYESPSMEHLTGRKANSRIGKNPLEFCHPEDTEKVASEFMKLLENKIPHVNIEIRLQHKDGRWLIFELVGTNLIDDPVVKGIVLNLRDITQRKQMEDQYRALVETMNDGLAVIDKDLILTYVNDKLCEMTGYSRDEIIGHSAMKLMGKAGVDEVNRDIFTKEVRKRRKGKGDSYEMEITIKNGSKLIVNVSPQPITDVEGNIEGSFGIITDITESKQMQEALIKSEEQYRTLVETMNDGLAVQGKDGLHSYVNDRLCEMTGYSRDELIGHSPLELVDGTNRDIFIKETRKRRKGVRTPYKLDFVKKDGSRLVVNISPQVITDSEGNMVGSFGVVTDITKSKEAEEALRKSEQNLKHVQEMAHLGYWEWDSSTNEVFLSEEMQRILGYDQAKAKFSGRPEIIHPDDMLKLQEAIAESQKGGDPEVEFRLIFSNGDTKWIQAGSTYVDRDSANGGKVFGYALDITERKHMEKTLRASEDTLNQAQHLAQVGSWTWNLKDNTFVLSNEMSRLYGIEEKEFGSFEDIVNKFIHPDDREMIFEAAGKVLTEGHGEPLVYRTIKPDGEVRWISATIPKVRHFDVDGNPEVMVGAVQDITERKQAEVELQYYSERLRAMAKQLSEVEESQRQRTARELHDNVGQNLTALGINLNIIKMKLEKARMEEEQKVLDDSQLLIEQTTESIRDVMANLRPPVLEDYGILATLKWYGQRFNSRTGIAITVEGEEPDPRMSADTEITLFRIYQEALTNISKHAKASNVTVNFDKKDGGHRLLIIDNGSGFDTAELNKYAEQVSWGLVTMSERADSIGASFEIESTPGIGTRVIIEKLLSC